MKKTIVVAGDTTVDWFMYPAPDNGRPPQEGPKKNWQLNSGLQAAALPGGAFLLGKFVDCATKGTAQICSPKEPAQLTVKPPDEVIHSNATLGLYRIKWGAGEEDRPVLRVRESFGYIGPADQTPASDSPAPNPQRADIVVLDDAGNGFRDRVKDRDRPWAEALHTEGAAPIVVHKMSRPLGQGDLWEHVRARNSTSSNARDKQVDNHVLVVNAADLRQTDGVQISRALSWERTAKDFVFQIHRSHELQKLRQCRCLIVLFDTDGAIIYEGGEKNRARLVYDPTQLEGGYASSVDGTMNGLTSVFTASLVAHLAAQGLSFSEARETNEAGREPTGIEYGVQRALCHARQFLWLGLSYVQPAAGGARPRNRRNHRAAPIIYPCDEIFAAGDGEHHYDWCDVEPPRDLREADPGIWTILDQKTEDCRSLAAEEVVRQGYEAANLLKGVPVGRFGDLTTIDRTEIESYSAIQGLIREYQANTKAKHPLCIAVFGPPGSGKSFGVTQVAKSVKIKEKQMLTFNISQFHDYTDLAAALHRVRNIALQGDLPFVFFDEFDTPLDDQPLGWLKYFLGPMQDGKFRDHGIDHPIGQAIFVFAGGTRSSFKDFEQNRSDSSSAESEAAESFRQAKGPDFVSRLRGYINIMGPNRQHAEDHPFIIRRALLLRGMFDRHAMAQGLFDERRRLCIDPGVLRALLCVSRYRHGIRSMTAIFDMSCLAGQRKFGLSALPPRQLLEAHVDAEEFMMLAQHERYQSLLSIGGPDPLSPEIASRTGGRTLTFAGREAAIVEAVAELIHDAYCEHMRKMAQQSAASQQTYAELSEEMKKSNRDAAQDAPVKLRAANYGLRLPLTGRSPRQGSFPELVIYELAVQEHERFCLEKRIQGYTWGPEKDLEKKKHPDLLEFDELDAPTQNKDFDAIKRLPDILVRLGYEIYPMGDAVLLEQVSEVQRTLEDDHNSEAEKQRACRALVDIYRRHADCRIRKAVVDVMAKCPDRFQKDGKLLLETIRDGNGALYGPQRQLTLECLELLKQFGVNDQAELRRLKRLQEQVEGDEKLAASLASVLKASPPVRRISRRK